MPVAVDLERCDGNGECVKACAFDAIEVRAGKAVVFDNCTDCGACVLACAPKALWSDLYSSTVKAGVLAVDFSSTSAIASIIERAARGADASAAWMTVEPVDAASAADAVAGAAKEGGYSIIALPHYGPGPAIAARVAARLSANLLAGCSELRVDDGGAVRAVRPRYGGIVKAAARCRTGVTVVTVMRRGIARVNASALPIPETKNSAAGEAPTPPIGLASRLIAMRASLSEDAARAVRGCAEALGARVIDPSSVAGKQLAPDLYIAFGVDGSTEHNASFRNSRVVVAVVTDGNAPIAQIADYLLIGDVAEHANAMLAAL